MSANVRVGVDVGGSTTEAVALGADGSVIAREERATIRGAAGVIDGIIAAIDAVSCGSEISSIGIGAPGRVSRGRVYDAVNLGIVEADLAGPVSARFASAVSVENDVRAATRGIGIERGIASLAYLNLGTGVAAGVLIDGRVNDGSRGVAGEIGHLSIDPAGPECACGQRGCIEAFAGGGSIAERTGRGPFAVRDAFDRADRGDEAARDVVAGLGRGAAAAVRTLALAADPDLIVIGGGIARLGDRLLVPIRRELQRAAEGSAFLGSLHLPERIELLPPGVPIGAIGAALSDARSVTIGVGAG